MIGTRPLLHNKIQDKRALKIKDQSHERDLNDHPLRGDYSDSEVEELVGTMEGNEKDDDYDPYEDDMYDSHNMSDNMQAICKEFDISIRAERRNSFILMFIESIVI
ncbi:hypothetical protein Tco_0067011 [Tanacetum coccineum]